jgi:hypothetical protein
MKGVYTYGRAEDTTAVGLRSTPFVRLPTTPDPPATTRQRARYALFGGGKETVWVSFSLFDTATTIAVS